MLRGGQTHVFPGRAAVTTAKHARTIGDVTSADVFAGSDPNGFGIVRVERNTADRVGVLIIKNRGPGGPAVLGFPDTAATDADVPGAWVFRIDRDIGNSTRHHGRADAAHLQTGKCGFVEPRRSIFVCADRNYRDQQERQAPISIARFMISPTSKTVLISRRQNYNKTEALIDDRETAARVKRWSAPNLLTTILSKAAFWGAELTRLRDILRQTELTEAIKWGAPCYTYENKNVVRHWRIQILFRSLVSSGRACSPIRVRF